MWSFEQRRLSTHVSRELTCIVRECIANGSVAHRVARSQQLKHLLSATLHGSALAGFLDTTDEIRRAYAHRLAEPKQRFHGGRRLSAFQHAHVGSVNIGLEAKLLLAQTCPLARLA
jgi:uncharacterized protein with beta-barrel porin domain